MADDEAEIYDGIRAEFPLSFGKQSKSHTSLEAIHNTTRRNQTLPPHQQPASSSAADAVTVSGIPSLSSSSKTRVNCLGSAKTPKPNPNPNDSNASLIGPPRPPNHISSSALDDDDGDALIGPPPPPPANDDDDGEMIGPPAPMRRDMEYSDSDADEDEEKESKYRIPVSNEIVLKGHTKVVSALAIDHTGSRVVTGSYDYSVRMYDFQGMNAKLQSFRQLEPSEGHQVRTISWSPSADRFLCVTGSAQAKIYDRDGLTLGEFVKGDMYIRDLKNTKGHITGLTCGQWHPRKKDEILTSSEDGSLRIWDVTDFKAQKLV